MPNHKFRCKFDVLQWSFVICDIFEEQLHGFSTDARHILAHGGQWRIEMRGEGHIIHPDDSQLVRDLLRKTANEKYLAKGWRVAGMQSNAGPGWLVSLEKR